MPAEPSTPARRLAGAHGSTPAADRVEDGADDDLDEGHRAK
ncbi:MULTISPECIES: hypothetical protein [Sorangium]|nr:MULTISPECIES: hypothetical protein [Sorangium]